MLVVVGILGVDALHGRSKFPSVLVLCCCFYVGEEHE
jgi:hypothetical protein